jgi:hypothetical protein
VGALTAVTEMAAPTIIFFRGLDGLIDVAAAERLAKNRGAAAVFYHYGDWSEAVAHVAANPGMPYHIVGFSRGAAPDVMGGFMKDIRRRNLRLPKDLMTVGLYGPIGGGFTPRYADPHFECINFIDSSGQRHAGEHNAVNLGAHVPHLGAGCGMELVADLFAHGKNPLAPKAPDLRPISVAAERAAGVPGSGAPITDATHIRAPRAR